MEPYVFDDVLTGSTVTCAYPGLDASAAKGASARRGLSVVVLPWLFVRQLRACRW